MKKIKHYWKQWTILVVIIIVFLCTLSEDVKIADVSPILAALIAGLIAFSINETVEQRRIHENEIKLREQREHAYSEIICHLLESFAGGSKKPEPEIRRKIVLWASKEFMRQYAGWRESITGLTGGKSVPIPTERKRTIQEVLGRLCIAARKDLNVEYQGIPVEHITEILFDDSKPD